MYATKLMPRIRKRISLTIDADVWERCQFLHRTAGANWSQVAEQAFSIVLQATDEMLAADALNPSATTPELRQQALALLKSRYDSALLETHKIVSDLSPCKVSTVSNP